MQIRRYLRAEGLVLVLVALCALLSTPSASASMVGSHAPAQVGGMPANSPLSEEVLSICKKFLYLQDSDVEHRLEELCKGVGEHKLVPTALVFKSDQKPKEVSVIGSWSEWKLETPAKKDDHNKWVAIVHLPQGVHTFKFIVDGEWTTAQGEYEIIDDGVGGSGNNIIDVKPLEKFPGYDDMKAVLSSIVTATSGQDHWEYTSSVEDEKFANDAKDDPWSGGESRVSRPAGASSPPRALRSVRSVLNLAKSTLPVIGQTAQTIGRRLSDGIENLQGGIEKVQGGIQEGLQGLTRRLSSADVNAEFAAKAAGIKTNGLTRSASKVDVTAALAAVNGIKDAKVSPPVTPVMSTPTPRNEPVQHNAGAQAEPNGAALNGHQEPQQKEQPQLQQPRAVSTRGSPGFYNSPNFASWKALVHGIAQHAHGWKFETDERKFRDTIFHKDYYHDIPVDWGRCGDRVVDAVAWNIERRIVCFFEFHRPIDLADSSGLTLRRKGTQFAEEETMVSCWSDQITHMGVDPVVPCSLPFVVGVKGPLFENDLRDYMTALDIPERCHNQILADARAAAAHK